MNALQIILNIWYKATSRAVQKAARRYSLLSPYPADKSFLSYLGDRAVQNRLHRCFVLQKKQPQQGGGTERV